MAYAKIDSVQYKCIWKHPGGSLDITPYILTTSTDDGITIENNKIELNLKLIKDGRMKTGHTVNIPWYANPMTGSQMLSKDSRLEVFVKYDNGSVIDTKSFDDRLKVYYITNWHVSEPDNKISISGVDLNYKIINRNTNNIYRQRYEGTSTGISGSVLTDSGASFRGSVPGQNYEHGLLYKTLEVSQGGNTNLYLITSNTGTTVTVHKPITETTGAEYRIGDSSASGVWHLMSQVARNKQGQGEAYLEITATPTLDYGNDYLSGIQMLRPDNSAFPIVDIGEPNMPVYKMLTELSGFAACNHEDEIITQEDQVIKRDMVYAINWNSETNSTVVNWFYLYKPQRGTTNYSITNVSVNTLSVSLGEPNDEGGIARIRMQRVIGGDLRSFYRNYTILDVTGNTYTLSGDIETDGVLIDDTFYVYKGTDFIWDNEQDFKHIYNLKLGGQDEEQYNHVFFDAGYNPVGERHVLGHWFNAETKSDTLKETFIPMTSIVKRMIDYCSKGDDGTKKVIQKVDDEWQGWDGTAFTSVAGDWDFTTNFGTSVNYTIASRGDFNYSLKLAARKAAKAVAKTLVQNQLENSIKGTIQTRGQKFLTVGSSSQQIGKWYQKGTRILFKRPEIGLNNRGETYYAFVVTKIRQQIDNTRWVCSLDLEYSKYDMEELTQ